jgi:hypothetical protein
LPQVRAQFARRPTTIIAAALALGAAVAAGAATQSVAASPGCRQLSASQIPVSKLEASYRKLTGLPANRPLQGSEPRRFGVCGGTHYVFELFTAKSTKGLTYRQLVAQQDHSPIWKQKPSGPWVDEGVDSLCNLAPAALINIWKVGDTCKA